MVGGAGEWPAKAPSPALCLCFPMAPHYGEPSPASSTSAQQKKRTASSPLCWRLPCALSVSTSTVRRGQDHRVGMRAMLLQDNRV